MKSVKIILQLTVAALIVLLSPAGHGEVVFSEDFESGSLGDRWERYSEDPALSGFEERAPFVHTGGKSYRITTLADNAEEKTSKGHAFKESDSWIRTWFLPGCDKVYIRWYAKFAEDFDQGRNMHWVGIGGRPVNNPRARLGGAGTRPDGTDRFSTCLDPVRIEGSPPPGQISFYSYWPDMKQFPDGYYWGNHFYPEKPFILDRGRWYCFEVMVKANRPGNADGEQVLWIDGEKVMEVGGMRWRKTDMLKLSMLVFGLYIHYCEHDCTYWLDDLVISTEYVGPMKSKPE